MLLLLVKNHVTLFLDWLQSWFEEKVLNFLLKIQCTYIWLWKIVGTNALPCGYAWSCQDIISISGLMVWGMYQLDNCHKYPSIFQFVPFLLILPAWQPLAMKYSDLSRFHIWSEIWCISDLWPCSIKENGQILLSKAHAYVIVVVSIAWQNNNKGGEDGGNSGEDGGKWWFTLYLRNWFN